MAIDSPRLNAWQNKMTKWNARAGCIPTRCKSAVIGLAIYSLVVGVQPVCSQAPSLPEERFDIQPADRVDLLLFQDPSFYTPVFEVKISNDPINLWGQALRRSESALTRMTADTISLAVDRGMSGLDSLVPDLSSQLDDESLTTVAKRAVIRALTKLDAREQAGAIAEFADSNGSLFEDLVDQAMTRWKLDLTADRWQQRLTSPGIPSRSRIRAIEGCAAIGLGDASEAIEALALGPNGPAEVRLAAGKALGDLFGSGLAAKAAALIDAEDSNRVDQQVAIAMLRRHSDPKTIDVLKQLTTRKSTATQFGAFQILYQIDRPSLLNVIDQFVDSPDANVRRIFADAILDNRDPQQIVYLAKLLDDVNPSLRMRVADGLVRLARDDAEYKAKVISEVTAVLDRDAWRAMRASDDRSCQSATYRLQRSVGRFNATRT